MCVCVCDIVALLQSKWPGASKAEGLERFYPLIIMIEKRATAPENWTEPPVSCCGQRAPHYPQCTTPRLHQRHNTMLTPGLRWIGLTFSLSLFFFPAYSEFNKCITHVLSKLEWKALLSSCHFKYIPGKFLTCFLAFNPSGSFSFPTKWQMRHLFKADQLRF